MDPIKEKLISVIYEGEDFEDPGHLQLLYKSFQSNNQKRLKESGKEEDAEEIFSGPGFEQLRRVLEMTKDFEWFPAPQEYFDRFQKSAELSTLLRDRANKYLYSEATDDKKVLRGYNLAIAFAPKNSAELALALERRADLLLRLHLPQQAQWDIQAVANNTSYPLKSLKNAQKLIDLQNRCSAALFTQSSSSSRTSVESRFVENSWYRLPSINKAVDNVTDFTEIDYHPHCGRKIVVTRNVSPGEVIMVDEPYSIILEKILSWDLEHCTNCSKPVFSGVPCDCCTFAWFCCNSCKLEGSRGPHKFEKYLSYLKSSKIMSLKALLAARLLFKVGPEELYRIFEANDPLFFFHDALNLKKGCNSKGIYTRCSYLPIFHLISHPVTDVQKGKANAFKALVLAHLIEDSSHFFDRFRYNENYQQFKNFISALILRHMDAIEYNAITLSKLVPSQEDINNNSSTTVRYGAGVYPLLCLINHSCDPNCVLVRSLKLLKTCVIAMKPLSPGDEVTFSYAPHFSTMELTERRKFLMDRYNFECRCEACLFGWGVNSRASRYVPESQCNTCGKYLLSGQCPKCVLKDEQIKRELPLVEEQVGEVRRLINEGKYLQGLEVVRECLSFCYENLPHNFNICLEYQELFKMLLVKLVSL